MFGLPVIMSVVITGTPGVGKHTVARGLAQRTGMGVIDINGVARDSRMLEPGGDTSDVDVGRLGAVLDGMDTEGMIVVGHLAPYALGQGGVSAAIILRRSPYQLLQVYRGRGYSKAKSMENAASEVLGIIAHDALERFGQRAVQIDVTGRSAGQAAELAGSAASGRLAGDEVDWLGTVAANNDLERFFAD